MKNLLYLFLIGVLFSCGGSGEEELNPEEPDVNSEPKEYIVSLGMTGEIEVSESPLLGRASSDDLYGINVYYKTPSSDNYNSYAYGLFDDKSKMIISLLEGYEYKFVATMIVNGKNRVTHSGNSYWEPFATGKSTTLSNYFNYNQGIMKGLDRGNTWLHPSSSTSVCPNTDRYYGETSDYTPSKDGSVSIDMKRVVFGAKFIADGLTEGKLIINCAGESLNIEYGKTLEIEEIFTFGNSSPLGLTWTADNYSEERTISVSWEKSDGAIMPIVTGQLITFKRKTLTTITIKVKDSSVNNGVEISQEPGDLIPGDNITIESGTGVENPVEPNI